MAITRSQQAKQMLQDGGRIGLKAGAQFDTSLGGGAISPGTDISGQFRGGDSGGDGGGNKLTSTIVDTAKEIIPYVVQPKIKGIIDLIRTLKDTDFDIITKAEGSELSEDELNLQKAINQKQLENKKLKELLPGGEITDVVPDLTNLDVLNKIAIDAGLPTQKKGLVRKEDVATPGSASAIKNIQGMKRYKDPVTGEDAPFSVDEIIDLESPTLKDLSDQQIKDVYDMVSLPGQNRTMAAEGGIMPRLSQLSGNVSSAEQMLQQINQRLESAESSLGSGSGMQQPLAQVEPNAMRPPGTFMGRPLNAMTRPENTAGPQVAIPASGMQLPVSRGGPGPDQLESLARSQIGNGFYDINANSGGNLSPLQPLGASGIPAAGYADGGNVVGGEYDFETARQMYGLGKLVKKITRTVKKVAKSPIGKAALLAAPFAFNPAFKTATGSLFKKGIAGLFGTPSLAGVPDFVSGGGTMGLLGKLGLTSGGGSMVPTLRGIGTLITGASAVAGLLTPEQEEEAQRVSDETGIDIAEIRANPEKYLAPRFRAGGGLMRLGYQEGGDAEPVAKKTMPLIDMDGMEKDYRETGGFVEMGRMEKADDVPARLSKNEFVFTADAVRNAGEGDIDKGAEVMYNMMKNLEAGGEVSEESQGLEGARKMFQTSQRLGEVL